MVEETVGGRVESLQWWMFQVDVVSVADWIEIKK